MCEPSLPTAQQVTTGRTPVQLPLEGRQMNLCTEGIREEAVTNNRDTLKVQEVRGEASGSCQVQTQTVQRFASISWKYVWQNYCLSIGRTSLPANKASYLLSSLGVQDGDKVGPHVRSAPEV